MDYKKMTAKTIVKHMLDDGVITIEQAAKYFPEFGDSEYERIRKGIIACVKGNMPDNNSCKKYIAWLEEQAEHDKARNKIQLGKKYKCIASPRYTTFTRGKTYKPEDEFLCSLMNFCSACFEPIEDCKQKPKFKVGDWITNGIFTFQICSIEDNMYLRSDDYYIDIETADKTFRLWSILDAKDGDILVSYSGKPFIFNGEFDDINVGSYCGINLRDNFITNASQCAWTNNRDIKPATKEQRRLLYQNINKAGYIWNPEKKELNKLK